jgi:hypothetical protein
MFRKKQAPGAVAALLVKTAQKYLGYTSDLGGKNIFGQKVGYDSQPWAGAFVEVCLREAGLKGPSFVYTPAALAEYLRDGNYSRDPRPGSIALFNFSSNTGHAADQFGMMHCGVVTDIREFEASGRFITVEGNVEGTTTFSKRDGVHQRVRNVNEVVIFCHPAMAGTFNGSLLRLLDRGRTKFNGEDLNDIAEAARNPKPLGLKSAVKHGDRSKKLEIIQLALATVTDLRGAALGTWDPVTAAACSRYQRSMGYVGKDVTGLPGTATLKRLAKETGLFTIDEN